MAVYNGERYLEEQVTSILVQLTDLDELIIVDDCSTDRSVTILDAFADPRMHLYRNHNNIGVVKSFERALQKTTRDLIFFSDQDDRWLPQKVDTTKRIMQQTGCAATVSDAIVIDETGRKILESFFEYRNSGPGFLKNFYKNSYLGCAMAIHKRVKPWVLPFPDSIPMHDEWIGLTCELRGEVVFIPEALIAYRRHTSNLSPSTRYPWSKVVKKRLAILRAIVGKTVNTRRGARQF